MTARTEPRATDAPYRGMSLMVAAMLLVPGLDAMAKLLMVRLTPLEVTAARFVLQSLVLLPFMLALRVAVLPGRAHVAAGVSLALALLAFNGAIERMPIANALAIFFVEPMILTVLSRLVLGERLGARRVAAVVTGLAGVLIVLRPNLAAFGVNALFPLAAALCLALYMLSLRLVAARGGAMALQFWSGASAAVFLCAVAAVFGEPISARALLDRLAGPDLVLLAGLGVLAAASHQLIARALALAGANVLAPLQYLELISALSLGWLIWGTVPDPQTWVGALITVSSGVLVFRGARVV